MPQQWPQSQVDQRTFGQQQARLLDDLNRPIFGGQVTTYLQDAMRYFQRRPFFFTDTDNTAALTWQPTVNTTVGTTIQFKTGGVTYAFVAANTGMTDGVSPNFASVVGTTFVPPNTTGFPPALPPPANGTGGTIIDNGGPPTGVIWLNNGPITGGFNANSQLTTLYNVNQYVPPIDLIAFTRVEVSWSQTNRIKLDPLSYDELRNYDVIRPTPPTTYPTKYAWYQSQLYMWPYPVALYTVTISYRSAPPLAVNANDSNIWTTQAEAMVRLYAKGLIEKLLVGDKAMADESFAQAEAEYLNVLQHGSQQDVGAGIPPTGW